MLKNYKPILCAELDEAHSMVEAILMPPYVEPREMNRLTAFAKLPSVDKSQWTGKDGKMEDGLPSL